MLKGITSPCISKPVWAASKPSSSGFMLEIQVASFLDVNPPTTDQGHSYMKTRSSLKRRPSTKCKTHSSQVWIKYDVFCNSTAFMYKQNWIQCLRRCPVHSYESFSVAHETKKVWLPSVLCLFSASMGAFKVASQPLGRCSFTWTEEGQYPCLWLWVYFTTVGS